jgi:hypothetical protein
MSSAGERTAASCSHLAGRQLEGDHAAEAEAEEIRLADAEVAEQRRDIGGEVLQRHLAPGVRGVPVPLQLDADDLVALGQVGQNRPERPVER